jgi:hypothetical protein
MFEFVRSSRSLGFGFCNNYGGQMYDAILDFAKTFGVVFFCSRILVILGSRVGACLFHEKTPSFASLSITSLPLL